METEEITPEIQQVAANLPPKMLGYTLIQDAGLKKVECAQILGVSGARVTQIDNALKKYGLKNLKMARLASNVVKNVLKGKPTEQSKVSVTKDGEVIKYTDNIYPTHANQLQAATMVYDRIEPIKRDDAGSQAAPVAPVSVNILFQGSPAQVSISTAPTPLPKTE
jgi:hypothetical protein